MINFGGLLFLRIYLSFGVIFLYSRGYKFIIKLNLSKSPYFSLIGNLGSSYLSLFISITPEFCPNAKSKFLEMYSFCFKLNSPNGYEKYSGL